MIPSANNYRTPVHRLPDPPEWTSKQAKLIWDLIRTGSPIVDLHVARRVIEVDPPTFRLSRNTTPELSALFWSRYVIDARRWIDDMEKRVACYGPPSVMSEPLRAPPSIPSDDRQSYLCRIMTNLRVTGWIITNAGGKPVELDSSNAYRAVAKAKVVPKTIGMGPAKRGEAS
jgi:hypothetical protein